jgi:hypothetical protein
MPANKPTPKQKQPRQRIDGLKKSNRIRNGGWNEHQVSRTQWQLGKRHARSGRPHHRFGLGHDLKEDQQSAENRAATPESLEGSGRTENEEDRLIREGQREAPALNPADSWIAFEAIRERRFKCRPKARNAHTQCAVAR